MQAQPGDMWDGLQLVNQPAQRCVIQQQRIAVDQFGQRQERFVDGDRRAAVVRLQLAVYVVWPWVEPLFLFR